MQSGETADLTPKKAPRSAGTIVDQAEFEIIAARERARIHALTSANVMPEGHKYVVAYMEEYGFAVFSHQSAKIFVLPLLDVIKVAQAAGIDKDAPLIIVPGSEVSRG